MITNFAYSSLLHNDLETEKKLKGIAFQVLNYWFALPIEAVLRIIPCPTLDSPIKDCLGLAEWEKQVITIIDLSQKLFVESDTQEILPFKKISHPILLLTQTKSAELCGFLTNKAPVLVDVSLNNIRSIPSSYRQVSDLSIISKMAVLNNLEKKATWKVFLLGEW